jgi:hypothetical protein
LAFLVRNIIDYNLLEGATIAAGKAGDNNEILWINLMEILDALDSLQKGELLITTGYQIDNEKLYKDIILRLKAKGLAGLAIQTGYYISEIPKYIIEAADKYNFPVIDLPQNLTFSYITRTLIDNINLQFNLSSDSDFINLKNKLETALIDNSSSTNKLLTSETLYPLHLFLLSISSDNNIITNDIVLKAVDKINSYFSGIHSETRLEWCGKKILYIVSLDNGLNVQNVYFDLSKILKSLTNEFNMTFLIGTSVLNSLKDLISSFNDALASEQILKKLGTKKGICSFEDIELFKMFDILHHSDLSIKFAYDTLKPVLDYDLLHKTSYFETLKLYLINECSIAETCSKLFIHRHTLKNRLNKISEICKIDFESYYSKMRFSMSIFIYDHFIG